MKLEEALKKKQEKITERWLEATLLSHSAQAASMARGADRLTNPIAYTTGRELGELYEGLLRAMRKQPPRFSVDSLIKIRAIQDFSPAEALYFPIRLKEIVRKEFRSSLKDAQFCRDLLLFESYVDEIALIAFAKYVEAREQIFSLKLGELKSGVFSSGPDAGCPAGLLDEWDGKQQSSL